MSEENNTIGIIDEANASNNHENEISEWAKRILHPRSSQEIYEKENDVCITMNNNKCIGNECITKINLTHSARSILKIILYLFFFRMFPMSEQVTLPKITKKKNYTRQKKKKTMGIFFLIYIIVDRKKIHKQCVFENGTYRRLIK